ncbi:MAG: AI-2E family transporter [Clostridia bacterium]|nr:AI-2E family transporter [Clostridia bacterium]
MKTDAKSLLKIGTAVFLLYLCIHYWTGISGFLLTIAGTAFPLTLGCVIAYLINILMSWFERHYFPNSTRPAVKKSRRIVCMIAAILSMLAIVALIVWLVLPQLIDCIMLIINILPGAIEKLLAQIENLHILPEDIFNFLEGIDWKSQIGKILESVTSGVGSVMGTVIKTVSSVFSGLVTALLAVIFALYILLGKDRLGIQFKRVMHRYLRPKWFDKVMYFLGILNDCFHKFIVGQCIEAVVLGLLCTLGMSIFKFPYATMIGALIAFTALIPVAGAYIGAGVGAFMILTVSPMQALLFLIFIVVLQQLEGNLIYPRVVGSSIGLPGIWVLAAVTIGGGIMGVAGMLVGVPLAAALYRILRDDLKKDPLYREKNGILSAE